MRASFLTSRSTVAALACVLGLCSAVVTGCGGTSSTGATVTERAHQTASPPETIPTATRAGADASRKRPRGGQGAVLPVSVPPGAPTGAHIVTAPAYTPPLNPCTLVTGAQAGTIVGAPLVSEKEAPLGPTCIFTFKNRPAVTIAIELLPFAKTVALMKARTRVHIGGFQADCGTLRAPMLDVSLDTRRVLNVTAPCPFAKALAVKALGRLHG